ncbi:unnamed protein product [Cunninghamella blakesleeana]
MLTSQVFHSLSLNHLDLPKNHSWLEPTSPTLSTMSWVADKSASEIIALLKNANATLREQEYDLNLTTELKQYLLQDNMKLHSQYESLLKQVGENEQQSSFHDDHDDEYHKKKRTLHEQQQIKLVMNDLEDKNMELEQLLESAQEQSSKLQNLHSKKTRELQNDIQLLNNHLNLATQHIQELEEQQSLDRNDSMNDFNYNNDEMKKGKEKKNDQHETFINELQLHITKLENENNQLIFTKNTIQEKLMKAVHQLNDLKQQFLECEGTQHDYQQLHLAYQQQIDHIHELHFSLEEHRDLLSTLHEENHFLSSSSTSTPDMEENDHAFFSTMYDSNNDGLKQNGHPSHSSLNQWCTTTTITPGKDLRSELENAWRKDSENTKQQQINSSQQQDWHHPISSSLLTPPSLTSSKSSSSKSSSSKTSFTSSSSPSVIINPYTNMKYQFTDVSCFYYSNDNEDASSSLQQEKEKEIEKEKENEEDALFHPMDHSLVTSYNLYPNLTTMNALVVKQQQNNHHKLVVTHSTSSLPPMKLVHKVQRWCRFAIVLTMAIAINIAQGPETMIEQDEEDEKH